MLPVPPLPELPVCDPDPPDADPLDWTPDVPLAPELSLEEESSDDDEQATKTNANADSNGRNLVLMLVTFIGFRALVYKTR